MQVTLEWTEPPDGGPGGWDMPLRATVTPDDGPTVELEITGWEGGIAAVTVRKQAGVVSRDLRLPIGHYLDLLAERFGLGRGRVGRRQPRRFTDDFLSAVADAYRTTNSIAGLTPERDERFYAANSTKYRWVTEARRRGFLGPREG